MSLVFIMLEESIRAIVLDDIDTVVVVVARDVVDTIVEVFVVGIAVVEVVEPATPMVASMVGIPDAHLVSTSTLCTIHCAYLESSTHSPR